VQPFRTHRDTPGLHSLRDQLHGWVREHLEELRDAEPDMPVEDRAADTWESLIAVADLAGADWPERARHAAKLLTDDAADADADNSLAIRLLADLRTIFGTAKGLHTSTILERLHALEDAPWAGRNLNAHDLSRTLRPYGVRPQDVREDGGPNRKGYRAADLYDAFCATFRRELSRMSRPGPCLCPLRKHSDQERLGCRGCRRASPRDRVPDVYVL
jgi:hypothetical protein